MDDKLEHRSRGAPLVYSSITNITVDAASERSHHTNTAQYLTLNRTTITCNHRRGGVYCKIWYQELKKLKVLLRALSNTRIFQCNTLVTKKKRVSLSHCHGCNISVAYFWDLLTPTLQNLNVMLKLFSQQYSYTSKITGRERTVSGCLLRWPRRFWIIWIWRFRAKYLSY